MTTDVGLQFAVTVTKDIKHIPLSLTIQLILIEVEVEQCMAAWWPMRSSSQLSLISALAIEIQ